MNQTFQNSCPGLVDRHLLHLMIVGLSATLPHSLATGLGARRLGRVATA